MKYTAKQKASIKAYWPNMRLRFLKDGTVEGQKSDGGSWGILYYPRDAINHLRAVGLTEGLLN